MQKPWKGPLAKAADEIQSGMEDLSDAYENAMRSALLNLVVVQEVYYADSNTYASRISDLTIFAVQRGLTVVIVSAGQDGWSASAAAVGSNKTCFVFKGAATKYARGRARVPEKVECA